MESLFQGALIMIGIVFFFYLMNRAQMGAGRMADFGKSRAYLSTNSDKKINFNSVAGLVEEKDELTEVVDFLKNPKKYIQAGARIPKGVLLVGPPGTGKTLLAKAVAGEAKVPFFSISGSDFVEMFVGVGASRVRDLFETAKRHRPCIVFIDEIDAVARHRGSGMGGGHDEREQTLNQLLVEMDGFKANEGIIVLAATNRVDILDRAILRPGRFDRKIIVEIPDVKGREEILKVYARDKKLSEDIDLSQIARTTAGFSGADLENLLNESAILAAKDDRVFLTQGDIHQAFIKVGIGTEKKSKVMSEKEKRITAYHEAGHAILFHVLPDMEPVYRVSIIPTGLAGGYTMPLPEKDESYMTKGKMLQEITVSLGGRVAEELEFGDITTGASQDIKQATQLAKSMVTKYGMSEEVGLINYAGDNDEVYLGRDLVHASRAYGESMAAIIDKEVKRIIDNCYARARENILKYKDVLKSCAEMLLVKEKISREEFESLFSGPVAEAI
jgi:cell division protease FtsH